MIDDMGIFRTTLHVAPLGNPQRRIQVDSVMVDTGSEYNWIPAALLEELGVSRDRVDRFETADGHILERDVGHAILFAAGRWTASPVVFAEPTDKVLLGAIGLEGLSVRIDLSRKELVPAGPMPAAAIRAAAAPLAREKRQKHLGQGVNLMRQI